VDLVKVKIIIKLYIHYKKALLKLDDKNLSHEKREEVSIKADLLAKGF